MRLWLGIAAVNGALAVMAGAFAAHGLAERGRRTEGEWAALLLVSAGRGRRAPPPPAAR